MRSSLAGTCVLLSALAAPAGAQVLAGGEFQVNDYTTDAQGQPQVAAVADGTFVVVWASRGSVGSDTSNQSIQARRYAADGVPLGAQFQVNTYTTGEQLDGDVAATPSGAFIVVWSSDGSSGTDTSQSSIQGQRYAANGSAQGGQFQINTYTTGRQSNPVVDVADDGSFAVAWDSEGSAGTDTSQTSIQAQRYAANGAPQGGEFQVNTYTTSYQYTPSLAAAPDGRFVVVWESDGSSGSDTNLSSVQGQRFDAAGAPQGAQFQVETYTTGYQTGPQVSAAADGGFVVAWRSDGSFGTDTDGSSTQARRYAANGTPQGGQFQVNTYTTAPQRFTAVAAASDGDFVVTWVSDGSAGSDSSYRSIQGQFFAADGAPQGTQFQVNTYTTDTQNFPAVTTDDAQFVVAWSSDGSSGTDTSDTSIQAQRYLPEPDPTSGLAAGVLLLIALRARDRRR